MMMAPAAHGGIAEREEGYRWDFATIDTKPFIDHCRAFWKRGYKKYDEKTGNVNPKPLREVPSSDIRWVSSGWIRLCDEVVAHDTGGDAIVGQIDDGGDNKGGDTVDGPGVSRGIGPGVGQGIGPGVSQGVVKEVDRGVDPGVVKGVGPGVVKGVGPGVVKGVGKEVDPGISQGVVKEVGRGVGPGFGQGVGPGVGKGFTKEFVIASCRKFIQRFRLSQLDPDAPRITACWDVIGTTTGGEGLGTVFDKKKIHDHCVHDLIPDAIAGGIVRGAAAAECHLTAIREHMAIFVDDATIEADLTKQLVKLSYMYQNLRTAFLYHGAPCQKGGCFGSMDMVFTSFSRDHYYTNHILRSVLNLRLRQRKNNQGLLR